MQLSVKDAAKLLAVTENEIHEWIKQDVIPVHRVGQQLRFNRSELLEWSTSRRMPISPNTFNESEDAAQLPSLTDALRAGGIAYGVGGTDTQAVLRAIVALLKLPAEVDRDFLYEVLLVRESLGSTGIGDGIAIPHVRNPVVLRVSAPTVTLCFLENPIDFGAVDGRPVNILFTLISPTVKIHLHLLSRLGFVLRDPEVKAALQLPAAPEALVQRIAAAEAVATMGPRATAQS